MDYKDGFDWLNSSDEEEEVVEEEEAEEEEEEEHQENYKEEEEEKERLDDNDEKVEDYDGKPSPKRKRTNIASAKQCEDQLENLASYVVECGGKRNRVKGWKASRMPSGRWSYHSETGNRFNSRPDVARWLKLPGALAVGQGRLTTNTSPAKKREDALERLASYVVECGGKRNRVKGWKASRVPSGNWYYLTEKGKRIEGRSAVARHLNLLDAPAVQTSTKRKS
jgi:hypothetical protein